uniref:Uncharacterized protein n=1 Tax=Rhizobium loti TaxID=381 RepID=Q8KGN0_RHILI|nr:HYPOTHETICAL PROTEIN [Mesorhizobium japonicum R7A]
MLIPIASVDETVVPSAILTETARSAGALPSGGFIHLALFQHYVRRGLGYDVAEPLYTEGRARRGDDEVELSPDRLYVALKCRQIRIGLLLDLRDRGLVDLEGQGNLRLGLPSRTAQTAEALDLRP